MARKGDCFYGSSNGRYDAVRISPSNSRSVQVRYNNGNWYDEWSSGGREIETLEWDTNNQWVDAVLEDGTKKHAVILVP